MTQEIKKYWDETGEGYQKTTKIPVRIHYGPGAPFEDELHLLGNIKGKRILEIGCGGAQCGIAMAKLGAKVTCIDISETQLKFAKMLAKTNSVNEGKNKITFYQGDIKKLPQIKNNSQDMVFSAWALHYIDNLKSCFDEVNRVLKTKGVFILAISNPYYFSIDHKTLIVNKSYFKTGRHEKNWKEQNGKAYKFVCYDRTLGEIINILIGSGFVIEKMLEPDSRKHYKGDPWYNIWEFTRNMMNALPPTIIFKCRQK